jgi:hypothetical protein
MTPEEALEYKKKGGKLAEPIDFNSSLKYEGPLRVTYLPAIAQGGPGDDSAGSVTPSRYYKVKYEWQP